MIIKIKRWFFDKMEKEQNKKGYTIETIKKTDDYAILDYKELIEKREKAEYIKCNTIKDNKEYNYKFWIPISVIIDD